MCRRSKLKNEDLSLSTVFLSHKLKRMPLALLAATSGPLACRVMNECDRVTILSVSNSKLWRVGSTSSRLPLNTNINNMNVDLNSNFQ